MSLPNADSGFYDKAVMALLAAKKINHIIRARLTQGLQQAIVDRCKWQQIKVGWWSRSCSTTPTISLFADDPNLQSRLYGAMLTDMSLPALEVWRLYRGRAE